jgi:dTDP-4-dehydrorhamnose reductase
MNLDSSIEIWGGIECTINRVKDAYHDQFEFAGHYNRDNDIELIGSLGVRMLRYPIIWEKHQPVKGATIDWSFTEKKLNQLRKLDIKPIAGLVHHGSGPKHVNFFDGSFEQGVAEYAKLVAEKFPWLEHYTPVNEPLTTARFCGLYGHWYPHEKSDYSFYKILISECKATVMAMKAIREINPDAKLIQTEDLGKCYSTPLLKDQADFENERRWSSYELITGRLTADKVMYKRFIQAGIGPEELDWFLENNCIPHVAGFNYYITSERYLDENLERYPEQYHGGNDVYRYADIEIVKVPTDIEWGPAPLIRDAWERLKLPIAITECHLHSTREEQMRWFYEMWDTVNQLKDEGIDIRAITAWAVFGLHGWNRLVTEPYGVYEPGVFNLSSGHARPTALARLIRILTKRKAYYHPVLQTEGWWKRDERLLYTDENVFPLKGTAAGAIKCQPVLIIGKSGTLGGAFSKICEERGIHHIIVCRTDVDITDAEKVDQIIEDLNPWAIINASGYAKVDEAEKEKESCFRSNTDGPSILAERCKQYNIKLLTFSSAYVFDGTKESSYVESDAVAPINVYGQSKAKAERNILSVNPNALIIRTSNFFAPHDHHSFVTETVANLKEMREVYAANDITVSPTYVPDLVNESLDLLLDNEIGIHHVATDGQVTWAEFACKIADMAGLDSSLVKVVPNSELSLTARRPKNNVLKSEKGVVMPPLDDALHRYMEAIDNHYMSSDVAI